MPTVAFQLFAGATFSIAAATPPAAPAAPRLGSSPALHLIAEMAWTFARADKREGPYAATTSGESCAVFGSEASTRAPGCVTGGARARAWAWAWAWAASLEDAETSPTLASDCVVEGKTLGVRIIRW